MQLIKHLTRFLLLTFLVSAGCSTGSPTDDRTKNDMLPERVIISSQVSFRQNEVSTTEHLNQLDAYHEQLLTNLASGKITAYNTILFPSDLQERRALNAVDIAGKMGIEGSLSEAPPEQLAVQSRQIMSGLFREEWIFDADGFHLEKRVINFQPVRHYPQYYTDPSDGLEKPTGDTIRMLLFSLHDKEPVTSSGFIKNQPDYTLLAKDFHYSMNLYNRPYYEYLYTSENDVSGQEVEQWAYHNFTLYKYFDRERFIDILLDKILSGSVPAYDVNNPSRQLSREEILEQLTAEVISSREYDATGSIEGIDMEDLYIPRENINSLIFIEDWYYDNRTMMPVKVVKGVVPVISKTILDAEGEPVVTTQRVVLIEFNN